MKLASAIQEEYEDEKYVKGENWSMYYDGDYFDTFAVERKADGLIFRFSFYDEALAFKELAERAV